MKKKASCVATLCACLAVMLAVVGCGGSGSSSSTSSGSSNSDSGSSTVSAENSAEAGSSSIEGKSVAFITCATSNEFCAALNSHLQSKLEGAGASVKVFENEFDPAKQTTDMNQAISEQPDLIILEATAGDQPIVPSIQKALAAGVDVMNIDGRVDPAVAGQLPIEVLSDNEALGRFAGENLVEGMEKAGNSEGNVIVITGTKGTTTVEDRMVGFEKFMAKYPQYRIVATEDGNWDPVKSGQLASQLFAKYKSQGGIQGAYGMADYQAVAISQAAQQAGMKVGPEDGGLVISGSNCTKSGIEAVQDGEIYGNASEDPITLAEEVAKWTEKFLSGEETPKVVTIEEQRITGKNAGKFAKVCAGIGS